MHSNKNYSRRKLDSEFVLEKNYFYKEMSNKKWEEIKKFINDSFINKIEYSALSKFFSSYKSIQKGNVPTLRELLDSESEHHKSSPNFFETYKLFNNFICNEYMMPKPSVLECVFFPSESNDNKVINMIRTCKKSLDIAIFTITNDKMFLALEEVYKLGREVRIITDDECCKQNGSDVYRLSAMVK